MKMRSTPYHLLLFLAFASAAWAQGDPEYYLLRTGSPTWTTAAGVERGFVNLANGNLHLEIPLASSPQRGSGSYSAKLVYDSRIWQNYTNGFGTVVWAPNNGPPSLGGWRFMTTTDPKGLLAKLTITDYFVDTQTNLIINQYGL